MLTMNQKREIVRQRMSNLQVQQRHKFISKAPKFISSRPLNLSSLKQDSEMPAPRRVANQSPQDNQKKETKMLKRVDSEQSHEVDY